MWESRREGLPAWATASAAAAIAISLCSGSRCPMTGIHGSQPSCLTPFHTHAYQAHGCACTGKGSWSWEGRTILLIPFTPTLLGVALPCPTPSRSARQPLLWQRLWGGKGKGHDSGTPPSQHLRLVPYLFHPSCATEGRFWPECYLLCLRSMHYVAHIQYPLKKELICQISWEKVSAA